MRLVLIDTCIWVPFFSRPQSAEKQNVDALLDDDRATLIGPIVTEILQGIPREPQAAYIASLLRGLRCLEMEWEDWLEAARLGAGKNEQFAHSPRAARSRAFTSAHGAAIAGFSRYSARRLSSRWTISACGSGIAGGSNCCQSSSMSCHFSSAESFCTTGT